MKYLILGAGPAGLTFANMLLNCGCKDFLVIEKELTAGGLCRTEWIDGPWDIGGGHFLDVTRKEVLDFIFSFMPEKEWNYFSRDSRIRLCDNVINSPIEANIWQLPLEKQVEYLKSIAKAGCNIGSDIPEKFIDWIKWKLGDRIAEDYMIPYNIKMFGDSLDTLGTYWLQKLPNVSFDDTLMSCLKHEAFGQQPAHASFYYPKEYGYGEVWRRMAERLGNRILFGIKVEKLDANKRIINDKWSADCIVTTIPWTSIKVIDGISGALIESIKRLKHTAVVTELSDNDISCEAQWIYYPDESLDFHRILVRKNFYPNTKGYWTETNASRFDKEKHKGNRYHVNEYAYPLNTLDKPRIMRELLDTMISNNIIGLGRWGEWEHYNSDVVVERAMKLAQRL